MELIVIVAIIGILAAVIVPTYQKTDQKKMARRNVSVLAGADAALARLPWQELVYKAPSRMEMGSTALVEVALGGDRTFGELSQLLQNSGNAVGQRVLVAARMEAHLTGSAFQIVATTPEVQLVSTQQPTEWHWQVKANDLGAQPLYLSLNALLAVNGKDTTKSVRTFERQIVVRVTSIAASWAFVERYWIYLVAIATAVASLVGYLLKKKFDRARKYRAFDDSG